MIPLMKSLNILMPSLLLVLTGLLCNTAAAEDSPTNLIRDLETALTYEFNDPRVDPVAARLKQFSENPGNLARQFLAKLESLDDTGDPMHPLHLDRLDAQIRIARSLSYTAPAIKASGQLIARADKILGPSHTYTLQHLGTYGRLHLKNRSFELAKGVADDYERRVTKAYGKDSILLGRIWTLRSDIAAAQDDIELSIQGNQRAIQIFESNPAMIQMTAQIRTRLGMTAAISGNLDVARENYEAAIATFGEVDSDSLGSALQGLATVELYAGRFKQAEQHANRALRIALQDRTSLSPNILSARTLLGLVYEAKGQIEDASEQLQSIHKMLEFILPKGIKFAPSAWASGVLAHIAIVESRIGDPKEAERIARLGSEGATRYFGREGLPYALHLYALALANSAQNNFESASTPALRALEILDKTPKRYGLWRAQVALAVALIEARQGNYAASDARWEQAKAWIETHLPKKSPMRVDLKAYAGQLKRTKDVTKNQKRSIRQGGIESKEANFRISRISDTWTEFSASSSNQPFGWVSRRSNPDMTLTVIATDVGTTSRVTLEHLDKMKLTALKRSDPDAQIISQEDSVVDGVTGRLFISQGGTGNRKWTTAHWFSSYNGFLYEVILGAEGWRPTNTLSQTIDSGLSGFKILDHSFMSAKGIKPVGRYKSSNFGYQVDFRNQDWSRWDEVLNYFQWAQFAARTPDGSRGVYIGSFPRWHSVNEQEFRDHLRDNTLNAKDWTIRKIDRGGITGEEYSWTLDSEHATAQILTTKNMGYVVLVSELNGQKSRASDIFKRVRIDAKHEIPKKDVLTESELVTQAAFANGVGIRFFEKSDTKTALEWFETAYSLEPQNVLYIQNLSDASIQTGRYADLIQRFNGIKEDQMNATIHYNRGLAYLWLEDHKNALSDFETVFKLGTAHETFWSTFLATLWQDEQRDRVFTLLEDRLTTSGTVDDHLTQVAYLTLAERFDDAKQRLDLLNQEHPGDARIAKLRIQLLHAQGEEEAAIEFAKGYTAEHGTNSDILYEMAAVQSHLGWYKDAADSLNQALEQSPESQKIQDLRTRIAAYMGTGDNRGLLTPIEPVSMPDKWKPPSEDPPADADEYGAHFSHKSKSVYFSKGKPQKRTTRWIAHIAGPKGIEQFTTLRFKFNPNYERMFVNKLTVTNKAGKLLFEGNPDDYFIRDDADNPLYTYRKVAHLPVRGLEVGARIELVLTIEDLAPAEEFRYFEHTFQTYLPLTEGLVFLSNSDEDLTVKQTPKVRRTEFSGGTVWIAKNLDAIEIEPLATTTDDGNEVLRISGEDASWESLANTYFSELKPFIEDNSDVDFAKPSRSSPVQDTTQSVQDRLRYVGIEFGRRGRIPNTIRQIADNAFGDCKDHSLLLLKHLEKTHIKAELALVNLGNDIDPNIPSLDQFNHMIVYCRDCPDAKFFDATDKGSDLPRVVPLGLAGHHALVLREKGSELIRIPDYDSSNHAIDIRRTIHAESDGTLRVADSIEFTGYLASWMRTTLQSADADELVRHLLRSESGLRIQKQQFSDVDDRNQPLTLRMEYEYKNRLLATNSALSGRLPAPWARTLAASKHIAERKTPFEIQYPLQFEVDVTVHAPDGMKVKPTSLAAPSKRTPDFHLISRKVDGSKPLQLHLQSVRKTGRYAPERYSEYVESVESAIALFEEPIVIE